jgi:hypothetical protein
MFAYIGALAPIDGTEDVIDALATLQASDRITGENFS